MKKEKINIPPSEIRRIRKKLGLSQTAAGEFFGGGPRAFTKYEAGIIKPTTATSRLLYLLDSNPSVITIPFNEKIKPTMRTEYACCLNVTGQDISSLSPQGFVQFMREVFLEEVSHYNLPRDSVHVAENINTPDGGEDARVEWQNGPQQTNYFPGRLVQIQMKSGKISNSKAEREVLDKNKNIKKSIREVLEREGFYLTLCARSHTKKNMQAYTGSIYKVIVEAGLNINKDQIRFLDADQIASWVNLFPSVANSLLEITKSFSVKPWMSLSTWSRRFNDFVWVEDDRLLTIQNEIFELISQPRAVIRITGLSGTGKSRLVYEAFNQTDELPSHILYAIESECGSEEIKVSLRGLAQSGKRAIVIIDSCSTDSYDNFINLIQQCGSKVSLIIIDNNPHFMTAFVDKQLKIGLAKDSLIDGIIKYILPKSRSEDHWRLVKFSDGFPQLAILLAKNWAKNSSIDDVVDDRFFDAILFGDSSKTQIQPLIKETAKLLSVFSATIFDDGTNDLEYIKKLGFTGSSDTFRSVVCNELEKRDVVKKFGRFVSIQPKPLAIFLAEQQWQQWTKEKWDFVLVNGLPDYLRKNAAEQLALMNNKKIALDVAKHVLRLDGLFASINGFTSPGNSAVINVMAEIDSESTILLLEKIMNPLSIEDLKEIKGDSRRNLVRTLEKTAYLEKTFERSALLLLRLAVAENEKYSNNATGAFNTLFHVFLSSTTASSKNRFDLLDDKLNEKDIYSKRIIAEALLNAIDIDCASVTDGPGTHGSRPTLDCWRPKTWGDVRDYMLWCAEKLITLALDGDALGIEIREKITGCFHSLIRVDLLDHVERWVKKVHDLCPYWPSAIISLEHVIRYESDKLNQETISRIDKLINLLDPKDLFGKTRFLVTEMPIDFPSDKKLPFKEKLKLQIQAVKNLASELLEKPSELKRVLPSLSCGNQRMAVLFGYSIATLSKYPLDWEKSIRNAFVENEGNTRNYSMLIGYYKGLFSMEPSCVENFKKDAANSPILAASLPFLCLEIGITPSDIELVCDALKKGILSVTEINHWSRGGVFAKLPTSTVKPFFDQLFSMDSYAYAVCLNIFGMYVYTQEDRLEDLRPQLCVAVENIDKLSKSDNFQISLDHLEEMVLWLLQKGSDDKDAKTIAVSLAKLFINNCEYNICRFVKSLLPVMLKNFYSAVWPLFSEAVLKQDATTQRIRRALKDDLSFDRQRTPPILYIPIDILFMWAHSLPDIGPQFLATTFPLLAISKVENDTEETFHPGIIRLLDEFGEREDVRDWIEVSMEYFSWSRSSAEYYSQYEKPLLSLSKHKLSEVRCWSQNIQAKMHDRVNSIRTEEDEKNILKF